MCTIEWSQGEVDFPDSRELVQIISSSNTDVWLRKLSEEDDSGWWVISEWSNESGMTHFMSQEWLIEWVRNDSLNESGMTHFMIQEWLINELGMTKKWVRDHWLNEWWVSKVSQNPKKFSKISKVPKESQKSLKSSKVSKIS